MLSFDWRGVGESCCDYMQVYLGDPNGVTAGSNTPPANAVLIGKFNNDATWQSFNGVLDGSLYANTTKRLYFLWHNDGSLGTNPAGAIDNLSVDSMGRISLTELEDSLRPDTIIVSIMHTNNEVGSLQPIAEAGALIKKKNPNCLFHVDAVQGFGKAEIYPKKMNIDLLSVSGHKIHGPKGIGILYVGEKVKIKPISYGGGQQKGMRNGTLNVPGIAGIGLATELITKDMQENRESLYELKEFFLQEVSKLDRVSINGCDPAKVRETAPHIINISVKGLRSEVMLHALEEKGVYVSAGSACASHSKKESSTLKSMGATPEEMDGALRISMSEFTTREELEYALASLKEVIDMYSRFIRK